MTSKVDRVGKSAFGTLAFIHRSIESKSWSVMVRIHKALVRPNLEYCVQFWSPSYRKDVNKVEKSAEKVHKDVAGT